MVSSDAGCAAYAEHSRGLIGAEAYQTPRAVKERVLVLDIAMGEACK